MRQRLRVGIILSGLEKMRNNRGSFIAFCGLDGSGKSTLIEGVTAWMNENGINYVCGKHPPDEWFSHPGIYKKYVLGETQEHSVDDFYEVDFTCNLRYQKQSNIISNLLQGKNVIYHRYIYSLFTYYQAVKTVSYEYIKEKTEKLLEPDIVFYARITTDMFYDRAKIHGLLPFQEERQHIEDIISLYDSFAEKKNWVTIDTMINNQSSSVQECIEQLNKFTFVENICDMRGNKVEWFE
jgi:dTMP kinase